MNEDNEYNNPFNPGIVSYDIEVCDVMVSSYCLYRERENSLSDRELLGARAQVGQQREDKTVILSEGHLTYDTPCSGWGPRG